MFRVGNHEYIHDEWRLPLTLVHDDATPQGRAESASEGAAPSTGIHRLVQVPLGE